MGDFEELKKDGFKVVATPPSLRSSLKSGKKKGNYSQYGFTVPYNVTREDSTTWVISTGRVNRSGGESGGNYYVSKKSPSKAIWD